MFRLNTVSVDQRSDHSCPQLPFSRCLASVAEGYIYSPFELLGVGKGKFPSDLSVHSFSESDFFCVKSLMWLRLTEVILFLAHLAVNPKLILLHVRVLGWGDGQRVA